jgi:Spy/CpxP family protein refolding chaperone
MKSLKIVSATVIAGLVVAAAMAAEEGKKETKGARLSPIARTMLRIEQIKSAIEGLDLSDGQKEKLGKIRDEFEAQKNTILAQLGEVLTDDQKQIGKEAMEKSGKKDRKFYESVEASLKLTDEQKLKMEPIGKELQKLVRDTLKQVMAVLTPEQKEKLQQKIGAGKKKVPKKEG